MSAGNKKRSWERQERHYCQYCNVWMGSDRQSILLHENGQKHKAAVDQYMLDKRATKAEQDKASSLIQRSLAQMEAAAQQSQASDAPYYGHSIPPPPPPPSTSSFLPHYPFPVHSAPLPPPVVQSSMAPPPPGIPPQQGSNRNASAQEKRQWEDRKKNRQEDNERKRKDRKGDDDGEGSDDETDGRGGPRHSQSLTSKRIRMDPEFGHYTTASVDPTKIWLEGGVFGEQLVEEDMPVQLWTGPVLATPPEKRLPERNLHWKDALILAVRKQLSQTTAEDTTAGEESAVPTVVVDVAYLESPDAAHETVVKSVPLHRIRILLGSPKDDRIPETLEEARIIALGGMEEEPASAGNASAAAASAATAIDEATGLSSWTTVSVKKTTVRQELREERERLRQKRRDAALAAQREAKRAEERKMEEAKVSNADDSALGAYDVWNRGAKEGYKGVDIHGEAKVEAHELGRKLAEQGAVVQFKKPTFKSKAKKQSRRTTSSDD
jgi:U1 zinc finger